MTKAVVSALEPPDLTLGDADPYHAGERALQQHSGVRERLAEIGARIVRDRLPEQHQELFRKLPFVLVGSVDAAGQPHASVLAGPPGFMRTPDAQHLWVGARPAPDDPLAAGLQLGASLGVLSIEPHTRRRNRLNGVVDAVATGGFSVTVQQSFGNCPKYIQARAASWWPDAPAPGAVHRGGGRLGARALAIVREADTFFIASSTAPQALGTAPAQGVDVSHRGGKPGFVRIDAAADGTHTLTLPDFSGNYLFNTLGNLLVHPRAGLLFIDFERGDLLHVDVDSALVLDGDEVASYAGALRLLRLRVRAHSLRAGALPLRWGPATLSSQLRDTGEWRVR